MAFDVVIRSGFESKHYILKRVAGGQEDYRHPDSFPAYSAADLDAAQLRQHPVNDEKVVLVGHGQSKPALPVEGHINGKVFLFKALLEKAGYAGFIFNNKQSYVSVVQFL